MNDIAKKKMNLKNNKKKVCEITKNNKAKIKKYDLESIIDKMKKIYFGKD